MTARINAFTILELLIVMIITSFIIVAGYIAYTSSSQRFLVFQLNTDENIRLQQLDLLLTKDINEATTASLISPKRLQLVNGNNEITYQFDPDGTFRKTAFQVDTFDFIADQILATPLSINRVYLSALSVKLLLDESGREVVFKYEKTYSPSLLLNSETP